MVRNSKYRWYYFKKHQFKGTNRQMFANGNNLKALALQNQSVYIPEDFQSNSLNRQWMHPTQSLYEATKFPANNSPPTKLRRIAENRDTKSSKIRT